MIERERKKKIEKRQAEEEKAMADIRRKNGAHQGAANTETPAEI